MGVLVHRISVTRNSPAEATLMAQYATIPDRAQESHLRLDYDELGFTATNPSTGQVVTRGPLEIKTARATVRMDDPPRMEYADLGPPPPTPGPDYIDLQRDEEEEPTYPYGVVILPGMAQYYYEKGDI
jgi:hypothetical protein